MGRFRSQSGTRGCCSEQRGVQPLHFLQPALSLSTNVRRTQMRTMTYFNINEPNSLQAKPYTSATFWRESHRQALADIRDRWCVAGSRFLILTWLLGLCVSLVILTKLSSPSRVGDLPIERFAACAPDGKFYVYPERYRFWSAPSFFDITLAHGNVTFTQAKVVDLAWDIVSNSMNGL